MNFKGQYLTYDDYIGLGGTLDNASFNLLEFEARKLIDKSTQGRLINLKEQKEETKLCVYKLIIEINKLNEQQGKTSESVGSYSVNYGTSTTKEKSEELNNIINNSLNDCFLDNGTPYLYVGVSSVY